MEDKIERNLKKLKDFMESEYRGEDIRFCSTYLFGDSKFIERNKTLANFFNSMAIVERPNIIYIRTDIDLFINGVNIKELTERLYLAAFFGGSVESVQHEICDVVISENLSFFMAEHPKNAIFLYNKGFHLTNQITTFVKRLKYKRIVFFGDFDCQGLAIYKSFKAVIENIEFYPDVKTISWVLDKHGEKLPLLDKKNCSKEGNPNENELSSLFGYANKKIEQEFLQVLFAKGGLEKPRWIM